MELLLNLRKFLLNHRKKIIISGIAIGGAVAVFTLVRNEEEKRQKLEVNDYMESVRRQCHFESIQITCDQTIIKLSNRLEKCVIQILNIDLIVSDLKNSCTDSLHLWEKLKVSAFTQICLMVYAQVLLVFILKIQFAIIGGYMYKNMDEKYTGEKIKRSTQEQYLNLCVSLIEEHLSSLCEFVKNKVTEIVHDLNLKKNLTLQNLQDIFWSIQTSINNEEFIMNMSKYLHIDFCIKTTNDLTLRQIYEETVDILCAKELSLHCVNSLLNCEFAVVMELLVSVLPIGDKSSESQVVKSLPTAKVLPILHNIVKLKQNDNGGHIWVKNIMNSEKLKILAANIYESFC